MFLYVLILDFALFFLARGMVDPTRRGLLVSFGAATLFYVPALLLIRLAPGLPKWSRAFGALAAVPFGFHAFQFLMGRKPSSQGIPATGGHILLTLAVVGWIVSVIRSPGK